MAHNGRLNVYSLLQDDRCCCGYKCGSECCSVHTWNDNLWDSLPHLNAVVTPENLQCVRGLSVQKTAERILHN